MDQHTVEPKGDSAFMERNALSTVTAMAIAGLLLLALTFLVR